VVHFRQACNRPEIALESILWGGRSCIPQRLPGVPPGPLRPQIYPLSNSDGRGGTHGPRTQDRGLAVGKADGAKAPDGPNHTACSHHRFGHPPPEPPTYPQNRGIALGIVGLSCAGFGEIGSAGFSGRRDGTRVSRPPSSDDGDIHPGEERPGNRVISFRAGEQWKRAIGFCIAYSSLRSFSR
jgi:hypothetical protein